MSIETVASNLKSFLALAAEFKILTLGCIIYHNKNGTGDLNRDSFLPCLHIGCLYQPTDLIHSTEHHPSLFCDAITERLSHL